MSGGRLPPCGAAPAHGQVAVVARFVEKPDVAHAERMLANGRSLWNSGIFVGTGARFLSEFEQRSPALGRALEQLRRDRNSADFFRDVAPASFDREIVEKVDRVSVVGAEIGLALFSLVGMGTGARPGRTAVYGLGFVFGYLAEGVTFLFHGLELRAEQGELHAEQARRDAAEARLAALQARTNPHFLFNSLNAIAGLVGVNPEKAERAVETLSASMRYALESTQTERVPLERELAAVRDHLELEKLRYAERLQAVVDVEPGLEALPVPPLCLQPVVENAITHGIAQREGGGRLEVSVRREEDHLLLRVDDDGPGPLGSSHAGTGTALADLRARLELLYGAASSLTVGHRPDGGCRVELRIPLGPARGAAT